MHENNNSMVSSAMNYAIPLGLFWVFKYLFIILGDYVEVAKYIDSILGIGTPLMYYILLRHYRDSKLGGQISYGTGIAFSLLLFVFASFIELVVVCLHIFVIKPDFLTQFRDQLITFAESLTIAGEAYVEQMKMLATNMGAYYIFSWFLRNIFLGVFLSLILCYFVSKPSTNHPKNMDT